MKRLNYFPEDDSFTHILMRLLGEMGQPSMVET